MNRTYVAWTLILAVLLVSYMALTGNAPSLRQQEAVAADGNPPSDDTNADNHDGHNLWMIVGTTVLVIVAVIATVGLAHLQHRRKEAYRKAAMEDRSQAPGSAASRQPLDLDDS
ncbi:MAG: hypothetical protein GXY74_13345 [Phycisphaerae bacterium]|nr:hypothetical protein [Phycisphaerae bacterium]